MNLLLKHAIHVAATFAAAATASVLAQQPFQPNLPLFALPDDVSLRKATILSDGSRLGAYVYSPKSATGKLPTIIMAYGWGGTMERFRTEAAKFAQAGYLVVMFDYRGWGESEGRVVLSGAAPEERSTHFTAEVIRNPCYNMIVESCESDCMTLRVHHDL